MYRVYEAGNGDKFRQLIVPKCLRDTVLTLAHDSLLSGHLGIRKTNDRVLGEFYWPGMQSDIRRYCQSCDVCQRTISKGKVRKVPLGKMPLIDTPFKRVAVDIVGSIRLFPLPFQTLGQSDSYLATAIFTWHCYGETDF